MAYSAVIEISLSSNKKRKECYILVIYDLYHSINSGIPTEIGVFGL